MGDFVGEAFDGRDDCTFTGTLIIQAEQAFVAGLGSISCRVSCGGRSTDQIGHHQRAFLFFNVHGHGWSGTKVDLPFSCYLFTDDIPVITIPFLHILCYITS